MCSSNSDLNNCLKVFATVGDLEQSFLFGLLRVSLEFSLLACCRHLCREQVRGGPHHKGDLLICQRRKFRCHGHLLNLFEGCLPIKTLTVFLFDAKEE